MFISKIIFRENSRNNKVQFHYFLWITLPLTLTLT